MKKPKEKTMELSYFKVQAHWGATKHIGGLRGTQELIKLCRIKKGDYVLDVGCGVGVTDCYLAEKHDCRVVGLDITKNMIYRSSERAKRKGVEDKVKFVVADGQSLPFKNNVFDAVIGESIISFFKSKKKGIKECIRVTKPGGYLGFNEAFWTTKKIPKELLEYFYRTTAAELETPDGWRKLFESAGFKDMVVRKHKVKNLLREAIEVIKWYGIRDLSSAWRRFFSLYFKNPEFRKYVKEMLPPKGVSIISKSFFKFFGYGIYVGRKTKVRNV